MITISVAGLNVGIDNQYDILPYLKDFVTETEPDFTVRVTPEEIAAEGRAAQHTPDYLEFICINRKIAEVLPAYNAFLFHGAAILKDDLAFLFTAPSGTGKTTHCKLWSFVYRETCEMLNGDKPIIRLIDGAFCACGTPWRGKEGFGGNKIKKIAGICLLNRGKENQIRRVPADEILPFLMKQVYLPKNPVQLAAQLSLMDACFRTVPLYSMECFVTPGAARLSHDTMNPNATIQT